MAKDAAAAKEDEQEVLTDSAPVEESPVDGSNEQVAKVELSDTGEYTADSLKTESKEEAPAESTAEETEKPEPQSEEELAPKSLNRFQKLANENRELKEQIEKLKAQEDQVATERGLLDEINPETGDYYTTQEIERIAFQQSREAQAEKIAQERYELEVAHNQQQIGAEVTKGLQDFPIFNEKSPEYNADLAALAEKRLQKNIIFDEQGNIIGAHDSPYEILQTINDALLAGAATGQVKAQQATEKMLANADSTGSSQQGESSFEKLPLKEMEAKLRAKGYDI